MADAVSYNILSNGSVDIENGENVFKRVSKLNAKGMTFTLKEILTMMTEDNIPMYQKLEDDGIAISQTKYNTDITFEEGDFLYLIVIEHTYTKNGIKQAPFIDITYNLNESAMKKVVEVLK